MLVADVDVEGVAQQRVLAGLVHPPREVGEKISDRCGEDEVQELDFSIGLHEGASSGMPQVGVDRREKRGARHIISHTMEMMLAALSVIWEPVEGNLSALADYSCRPRPSARSWPAGPRGSTA